MLAVMFGFTVFFANSLPALLFLGTRDAAARDRPQQNLSWKSAATDQQPRWRPTGNPLPGCRPRPAEQITLRRRAALTTQAHQLPVVLGVIQFPTAMSQFAPSRKQAQVGIRQGWWDFSVGMMGE